MSIVQSKRTRNSRAAILKAAQQLIAERGLNEFTMDDVAAVSGVSRATVFNHFGSRALILDAIAADILGFYLLLLEEIMNSDSSLEEQLLELVAAMAKGITNNKAFYKAFFNELVSASYSAADEGRAHQVRKELDEKLLRLFLQGQVDGQFSTSYGAQDMVMAFDSQVFGSISYWLQAQKSRSLAMTLKSSCLILLTGISVS